MRAEIIGVGKESMSRELMGSVGNFLQKELTTLGIELNYQSIAGEDKSRLAKYLSAALEQSDIILLVGGLGPAPTDYTKEMVCKGLDVELAVNEDALGRIRAVFDRAGKTVPREYAELALLPSGAVPFPNDCGLAYGCALSAGNQCILLVPHSIKELSMMYTRYIKPYLASFTGAQLVTRTLNLYDIPEEEVQKRLGEFSDSSNPSVTVRATHGDVTVEVSGIAKTKQESTALCTTVLRELVQRFGDKVYGVDAASLEQITVRKLLETGKMVATGESSTGGLVYQMLSGVPRAKQVIAFAAVTQTSRAKTEQLEVTPEFLKKYGSCSSQVAAEMAYGALIKGESDYGIGITGNAGHPADADYEPGTIYIAVCDRENIWVKELMLGQQDPDVVREIAAMHALNLIRLILDYSPDLLAGSFPLKNALKGKITLIEDTVDAPVDTSNLPWYQKLYRNLIPQKGDDKSEVMRKCILLLAMVIFFSSAGYIFFHYYGAYSNRQMSGNLQQMFETGEMGDVELTEEELEGYPKDYQLKFASLYNQNPDIRGWIKIDGTQVNYPVVQSKDNLYYERRDFYEKSNQHGVPFLDYESEIEKDKQSDHMLVYGHNMKDGQMFGEIIKYKDLNYYKQHPIIQFDNLYRDGRYKIVSVFITNTMPEHDNGNEFKYYSYIDFKSAEEEAAFVDTITKRSLINTGVDIKPDDNFLTLSTCTYEFLNARFVVVARMVRDGESETVDVNQAQLNPNPVYPAIWYQIKNQKPPAKSSAVDSSKAASAGTVTSKEHENSSSEEEWEESSLHSSSKPKSSAASSSKPHSSSSASSSKPSSSSAASSSKPSSSSVASSSKPSSSSVASSSKPSSSLPHSSSPASTETPPSQPEPPPPSQPESIPDGNSQPEGGDNSIPEVAVATANGARSGDASQIIAQVVMNETGGTFSKEALKAQAVAAYTYITYENEQGRTPYLGVKKPSSTVQNAVDEVLGEAVYYRSSLAYTPFHAISAGTTNSSKDVWGGNYSYLQPVDSSVDTDAKGYEVTTTMTASAVKSKVKSVLGIDLSDTDPEDWFTIESYTEGGYNDEMTVGGYSKSRKNNQVITGRLLRESVLNLRSACFEFEYNSSSDKFIFTTYGYGHGVGMSQIGANELAKDGWDYEEILTHYYPGTTVK